MTRASLRLTRRGLIVALCGLLLAALLAGLALCRAEEEPTPVAEYRQSQLFLCDEFAAALEVPPGVGVSAADANVIGNYLESSGALDCTLTLPRSGSPSTGWPGDYPYLRSFIKVVTYPEVAMYSELDIMYDALQRSPDRVGGEERVDGVGDEAVGFFEAEAADGWFQSRYRLVSRDSNVVFRVDLWAYDDGHGYARQTLAQVAEPFAIAILAELPRHTAPSPAA